MKQHLLHVWHGIDQTIIDNAIDEWCGCLRICLRAKGGHLEQLLWQYLAMTRDVSVFVKCDTIFASDKSGGKCVCPRLSVCLSVTKITKKREHGFGWNVACRQMSGHGWTDYLLSSIRIIVQMPEPDCFLCYRISAGMRNFTSGKSIVYIGHCSDVWFYNGFIHWASETSKHLCRRYMRSTECPSS